MGSKKDNAITIFRLHAASVLLIFEEKNSGFLNLSAEDLHGMIFGGALSLDIINTEERYLLGLMSPDALSRKMLEETEKKYPKFSPVAGLAQTATLRLLYRGTAIENDDITEIMALELTTKPQAAELEPEQTSITK